MHLPIGVIYDQINTEENKGDELGPPWSITVRFGDFPGQDLLRCHTRYNLQRFCSVNDNDSGCCIAERTLKHILCRV